MKEFDFDELDRAVSSALGGQASKPVVDETPSPASSRVSPVVVDPVRETIEMSVPERPAEAAPAPRTATPSRPPRTSGRFMDVVHPSVDMRQAGPLPEVRRVAEVTAPIEEPVVAPRQEVPMADIRAVPRREVEQLPVPTEIEEAEDDWSLAPDSPFLPDARVEKRPLGASEPTGFAAPAELPEIEDLPVFEEMPSPDAEVEVIEAEPEVEFEVEVDTQDEPEVYAEMDVESVPEFDVTEAAAAVSVGAMPELTPLIEDEPESTYAGPVAITPQYTPKPSANQESGEIFDTESYHQPFAAPVKKKGGALKIILITLLVLVLGVAAGGAFYLYVLPTL